MRVTLLGQWEKAGGPRKGGGNGVTWQGRNQGRGGRGTGGWAKRDDNQESRVQCSSKSRTTPCTRTSCNTENMHYMQRCQSPHEPVFPRTFAMYGCYHWTEQCGTSLATLAVADANNTLPTVGMSAQETSSFPDDKDE